MQQLARLRSAGKTAFTRITADSSPYRAVIRLVVVFALAGVVQVLAGWLLR